MTSRRAALAAVLLVALALAPVSSCAKRGPRKTTTPWPAAAEERRVPRPEGVARWPLTGIEAPSLGAVRARVVSVKIENSPASRPQSNLDSADIVYETLTEGGISRFNALYHSRTPDNVGPVRSARLSDVHIVPQYGALFARVGGNAVVQRLIRRSGIDDMDQFGNEGAYWRSPGRPRPHNMYTGIERIRRAAAERGLPTERAIRPLAFGSMGSAASTTTIGAITVPFAPDNRVTWTYDAATKTYVRDINGRPHSDRASGERYATSNVVVLWAKTSSANRTQTGYSTLEIALAGEGDVSVFREGVRYDGKWSAGRSSPPVFRNPDGRLIKLSPGITWFQVVPTNINIAMR